MVLDETHLHSYERMPSRTQYRCIHPDCTHFQHRAMIKGKRARCPTCLEEFIINRKQVYKQKLLKCANCSSRGKKAEVLHQLEYELQKMQIGEKEGTL